MIQTGEALGSRHLPEVLVWSELSLQCIPFPPATDLVRLLPNMHHDLFTVCASDIHGSEQGRDALLTLVAVWAAMVLSLLRLRSHDDLHTAVRRVACALTWRAVDPGNY